MSLSFGWRREYDGGRRIGNALKGKAVADVLVEVDAFGFGFEQILETVRRNLKVQIVFTGPKLKIQSQGGEVVESRSQKG